MKITKLQNAQKVPFDLNAFVMHSDEEIELVHLILKPGEKIDLHKNPFDVIFYAMDGEAVLTVEDTTYDIAKYQSIRINKSFNRALSNNSNNDFTTLVIKLLNAK